MAFRSSLTHVPISTFIWRARKNAFPGNTYAHCKYIFFYIILIWRNENIFFFNSDYFLKQYTLTLYYYEIQFKIFPKISKFVWKSECTLSKWLNDIHSWIFLILIFSYICFSQGLIRIRIRFYWQVWVNILGMGLWCFSVGHKKKKQGTYTHILYIDIQK